MYLAKTDILPLKNGKWTFCDLSPGMVKIIHFILSSKVGKVDFGYFNGSKSLVNVRLASSVSIVSQGF